MTDRKKELKEERKVLVTIRSGKNTDTNETWQYYSIVNVLRWYGATQQEAYAAAKWAQRAKPGETRTLWPDITMETK